MYSSLCYITITTLFLVVNLRTVSVAGQNALKPPTVVVPANSQWCLGCICQAISNCSQVDCEGDVCGVFRITWAYWADAGKHVLPNEDPKSASAYPNCTRDTRCAGTTVTGYLTKFSQDCNADGIVDCEDYGAIHKFGGYGCSQPFSGNYFDKLRTCIKSIQSNDNITIRPQSLPGQFV